MITSVDERSFGALRRPQDDKRERASLGLGWVFVVACGLLTCSHAAQAYGPVGHQIVGAIADARLAGTPTGRKVAVLLDGFTLQKAAVIPDEIRGWDTNGPDDPKIFHYSSRPRINAQLVAFWKANPPTHDRRSPVPSHHWFHYTDVPVLRPHRHADGDAGRSQWDIVHAMRYCIAVLCGEEPEENARKITKPIAIILLAHFVGDIHQPLHVGALYFNEHGAQVDLSDDPSALGDEGGNTITFEFSRAAANRLHHRKSNLHAFWDNHAVALNLPDLTKVTPKEARRAQSDEARSVLVQKMAAEEPQNWRVAADVALASYPEAWADQILPIAREANERLVFRDVRPQQIEERTVAAGVAQGKTSAGGVEYEDWAAAIVRVELHKAGWRLAALLEKALERDPQ